MSTRPVNYCDYERNDLLAGRAMWQREYKVLEIIRRRMPENMQAAILDVGCGDGTFLQQLDRALGGRTIIMVLTIRSAESKKLKPSRLVSAAATLKKEFLTMTLVSTSCIQEK